jgi:hypothetical protein
LRFKTADAIKFNRSEEKEKRKKKKKSKGREI